MEYTQINKQGLIKTMSNGVMVSKVSAREFTEMVVQDTCETEDGKRVYPHNSCNKGSGWHRKGPCKGH